MPEPKETDLFEPVMVHLQGKGYEVAAEVSHCDIVARKGDELVVVEQKTSLNMTLLTQAVDRQSITPLVYVAIPEPKRPRKDLRIRKKILERLGIGLMTVYHSPLRSGVTVVLKPSGDGQIVAKRRQKVLRELEGRSIQPNIGGSSQVPVYTAYRETAITIANLLQLQGPCKVSDVRILAGEKTGSILYTNHYGWFERIDRGIYQLTTKGISELDEYPELNKLARRLIEDS